MIHTGFQDLTPSDASASDAAISPTLNATLETTNHAGNGEPQDPLPIVPPTTANSGAATVPSTLNAIPETNNDGNGEQKDPLPLLPTTTPDGGAANVPTTKKPRTERQLRASRNNGRKSPGPKTPRGKARSRLNAARHGLYATLPVQDLKHIRGVENLEQILAGLREDYPPQTTAQAIQLEQLAFAVWRRARVIKFEVEISDHTFGFNSDRIDKAVRLSLAVHKMTEGSFAQLEQLDQQAKVNADAEDEGPSVEVSTLPSEGPSVESLEQGTSASKPPCGVDLPATTESVG